MKNKQYILALFYMYILCCLKWLSFNPDSTMRVKLMWTKHRKIEQSNKNIDICAWIYSTDEETMEQLMSKSITRDEIIEIEIKNG